MAQTTSYLKALKKFWEIADPTELKFNRVDTLYGEERTDELFDALVEERVNWLLSCLKLPENPKILEIGCGIGSVIKSLSKKLSKNSFFLWSRHLQNHDRAINKKSSITHKCPSRNNRWDYSPVDRRKQYRLCHL